MTKKKPRAKKRRVERHHLENSTILIIAGLLVLLTLFVWKINSMADYKEMVSVNNSNGKFQIDVPIQMKLVQSGTNVIDYQHLQPGASQSLLSHVRAESQFIGEQKMERTRQMIIEQLKKREGPYFSSFEQKAQGSPAAKNLNFTTFTDYKTANITHGAVADFSYDYDDIKVSGRMLIAFGRDSVYIITLEATQETWQDNQPVWDKILASFKFN